jgi:ketosteroid isomerase-like protein
MAHPNEDLVRRGYAAFGAGDLDTIRELFADDIVWHSPGHNQISGDFRGMDEVLGQFGKIFELTGGSFKLELHDVLANDEHAVGLIRATGDVQGRHLDDNTVQLFHIRDGKVTESWIYPGDPEATDAFWG